MLPKFADSERLLTLSMMSPATGDRCERTIESQLNYVLLLKSCLEYIGILKDALSTAQHPYFKSIHNVRLDYYYYYSDLRIMRIFSFSCCKQRLLTKSKKV